MSVFALAPKPPSLLGYHRVLSSTAGVKVSPLCLGTMNFGTTWKDFMGECDKEQSFALLDEFFRLGGNFLDTANNYQQEESETWIGEWMKARGNRDQMVIATKYTTGYRTSHRATQPLQSNYVGNSLKSLRLSVTASLEKLQTDYIDILYVHWWDFTTSVEEVMHGLNALVTSGRVLYLGVSDTPAWIVVKANDYARAHGLRPFSVYQGKWNAGFRDIEREILPMCRDQGMAIAPWAPLGQGRFKAAKARDAGDGSARASKMSEEEVRVSDALEKIAQGKGVSLHAIALAYILHKSPHVFPIIGQRKIEHLRANVEALSVRLSASELDDIDAASSFDVGFPMNFIFRDYSTTRSTAADVWLTQVAAHIDAPPHPGPVVPRGE
ncbi:Sterigmatocystin biosynthesis dehydrogenase stcV [Aspergillus mulundensis]|uniref:Sterigmatocystin biosynthesis dehydrogenase stcV n=1 Tax=Aspergillus mulundensis TaxID=1810919 RepID=A0A3D8R067_9EURO|nr:Sterigmatocystin biosynthesis dehydrogenase stcV [Aspergillus mulundensis]RDW67427.1 Sterigmatocystin biosynthesis dehydrogenase stcV [Aspergillus mulundensis]